MYLDLEQRAVVIAVGRDGIPTVLVNLDYERNAGLAYLPEPVEAPERDLALEASALYEARYAEGA